MIQPAKPTLWAETTPTVTTIVPELAVEIGLNESLVFRQIVFWITTTNNLKDGEWWTYQSLKEMKEKAFPYLSITTISRAINNLVKKKLIKKTSQYNKRKNDRTQWFAIDMGGASKLKSVKLVLTTEKVAPIPKKEAPQVDDSLFHSEKPIFQNEKTFFQNETTLPDSNPDYDTQTLKPPNPLKKGDDALLTEMVTLVKSELKQLDKRRQRKLAMALLGRLTGKDAEYNLSQPFTPDLLKAYIAWWDTNHVRDGKILTRPRNLGSTKTNAEQFLEERANPIQITANKAIQDTRSIDDIFSEFDVPSSTPERAAI